MRFNELMTGARQDVVCKIFGEDLDTLANYAARLGKIISSVQGAKNLYLEAVSGIPQVLISYNRNAIAQYRLNIADINKVVNAALAGQNTGMLFEGDRTFRRGGTHERQTKERPERHSKPADCYPAKNASAALSVGRCKRKKRPQSDTARGCQT